MEIPARLAFFAISNSTEMIEFMNIQRILSIIISVLTIIPLYYLIKNFFKKEIAIVAASLFIFSPKIIENSILGITDPLFIITSESIIIAPFEASRIMPALITVLLPNEFYLHLF